MLQSYNMSSQGGDQLPREQEEQEDFYDCQEILDGPGQREGGGGGEEEGGGGGAEEVGGGEKLNISTDKLTDRGHSPQDQGEKLQEEEEEEEERGGLQEQEQTDGPQEELRTDRLQEEEHIDRLLEGAQTDRLQGDSDSELKPEEVEFDDDYLRELEKDLTEEEKEVPSRLGNFAVKCETFDFENFILFQSRRLQSLTLKEKGNSQFKCGGE